MLTTILGLIALGVLCAIARDKADGIFENLFGFGAIISSVGIVLFGVIWSIAISADYAIMNKAHELRTLSKHMDCYPPDMMEDVLKCNRQIEGLLTFESREGYWEDLRVDDIDTLYVIPIKDICKN